MTGLLRNPVMKTVTLNTNYEMPIIGLGTFKLRGYELLYTVLDATLKAGYRSIDTAAVYRNESDIGKCLGELLPKYGLKREDLFITSKLGPKDQGKGKCREACLQSISNLNCDYLDLYLIHWPGAQGLKPEDPRHKDLRKGSWIDMENLMEEGKIKSIGVSNYLQHHIEELLSSCKVTPAVLQTEHHPHCVQTDLVKFCQKNNIHFQAYSSLGTTDKKDLLSDPVVEKIASKLQKSPAQILLRWAVQQGIGVLPKSSNPKHISENIDIFSFELADEDITTLKSLDGQYHYCWNPQSVM